MGGRRDRDIERELEEHLRRETEANQASGMGTGAARRKAVLDLGSAERWREEGREAKGGATLENWVRDLRLAARGLRRTPGFALAAILTLALGIGANTAMFSVIEAVLLRPLPFAQPQQLVQLWESNLRQPGQLGPFSYPDFQDVRHAHSLLAEAAYTVVNVPLTGRGEAQHLRAAEASDDLFDLLGVPPALGRGFRPGDDRPGALAGVDAAVLSDELARREFGTPAAALRQRLVLGGRPYQVIGVMAPGFQFPLDDHEDLWLTLAPQLVSTDGPPMTSERGAQFLHAIARLAPGATPASAQAELRTLGDRLAAQYPGDDKNFRPFPQRMLQSYTAAAQPVLLFLLAAVGCVLLIACVNVAGLLLARAARRKREFALRAALGASRGALLRQALCESLVLGLGGASAGVGVAWLAARGLTQLGPANIVRLQSAGLNPAVLGFALGLGLITALLFGLAPALALVSTQGTAALGGTMQAGARSVAGGPRGWRRGLIAVQFGLALAVLIAAGLLLHSLGRMLSSSPGYDPNGILQASINLPDAKYPKPGDAGRFFTRMVDQLRQQPGIMAAAAALPFPLGGGNLGVTFDLAAHPLAEGDRPTVRLGLVTPGYFAAMRIPLLSGRAFTAADRHAAPQVAIVSASFARRFLAGRPVLGTRFTPDINMYDGPAPVRTIVGVVADVKNVSLAAPPSPMVYLPENQAPFGSMVAVVRIRPGAQALVESEIRHVVRGLDPDVPIFDLKPMRALLQANAAPLSFDALLLGLFAGLALLLAAIGLYAVMAQAVAQRRREIGIRVALGAGRGQVGAMVVREGMAMALLGAGAGLAVAAVLSRALQRMLHADLYQTTGLDPLTFVLAPLLLLGIALLACGLPARRAASADPIRALRED